MELSSEAHLGRNALCNCKCDLVLCIPFHHSLFVAHDADFSGLCAQDGTRRLQFQIFMFFSTNTLEKLDLFDFLDQQANNFCAFFNAKAVVL